MARESVHAKIERVRPPRVHVTYNVEIGNAIELKEIPFVMGVLADLSGMPEEPLPKIKDRRFVEITPDNFDAVLDSMKPQRGVQRGEQTERGSERGQDRSRPEFQEHGRFRAREQWPGG